jgi:carboxypeptidase C (cathepsin A)
MRISLVFIALALAACASPPPPAPAPTVTRQVKIDNANVEDVQHAGYTIVNKDGEKLYCRTDAITGSRVQTRTSCLTEREMSEQNEATRESMDSIKMKQTGPSGPKVGGGH